VEDTECDERDRECLYLALDKAGCLVKELREEDAPAMILMRGCSLVGHACMQQSRMDESPALGALYPLSRTYPVI
jgi:hypothetical protein